MTRSELIEILGDQHSHLAARDVESAVKSMLEHMSRALSIGGRIEIRGFGTFCLHYRQPRKARNPKTGEAVQLSSRIVPHFKPGKELKDRVNATRHTAADVMMGSLA